MKLKFTKMHGAGNDYIYIDGFSQSLPGDPAGLARRMSDRHFGVGGDGLILILPSGKADCRMRMFNADGSEAEMCGNGIRCVAKYAYERGLSRRNPMTVETGAGVKTLRLHVESGRVREVEVRHEPRRSGRSKYGVGRVLRVAADALSIHLLLRHGHRPSGWFLKSALVFLAGAAWAAAWAGWSAAQGAGRPSVVGAGAAFLLGVCGMSLAAFGWFAELLLRLEPFRLQRERSPLRDGGESGRRARGGAARERRGTTWERRATARERGGRPGPEVVS